jgi:[citrate (pro-3S)-lyase] ligase
MMQKRWAQGTQDFRTVRAFLAEHGLEFDPQVSDTILVYDDARLVGSGSLDGGVLKCIAVRPDRQGEGLLGSILTALVQKAYENGNYHLFVYTKPKNENRFRPFGFHPIASTESVLLMENRKDGIRSFVRSLAGRRNGIVGSVVMNANPFTLGHRHLVEQALEEVDELQVFVLSSAKSIVPPDIRLELVRQGCADLNRVVVQQTGDYLISPATFPTYFLPKDTVAEANAGLDIRIFVDYFAKELKIAKRFLGTEPSSPVTASYNRELAAALPREGVEVTVIPRKEVRGEVISASRVRAMMESGEVEAVRHLVPEPTFRFLQSPGGRRIFYTEKT